MMIDNLKNKTKEELLKIIEQMIDINPNNQLLVSHILKHSKPNYQTTLKKIEKEMRNHQGSYRVAYNTYKNFFESNPEFLDSLKLAIEILPYFLEELDSYHDYPKDLTDMVIHIYELACLYAVKNHQIETITELYQVMSDYDFLDDINVALQEVFYSQVPSEISDEIDK